MKTTIIKFRQDENADWVADLACGHSRHFRHNPPWQRREWVTRPEGREKFLGTELHCQQCEEESGKAGQRPQEV